MTLQETGEIMDILVAAYPRFYSRQDPQEKKRTLALWAEILRDYPLRPVAYAVKTYIVEDTRGFPPSIGQILDRVQLISGEQMRTPEEAWDIVYRAICRSGWHAEEEYAALPEDIKAVVRSPHQLWTWAMDEKFNAGVESSNFKRAYKARQDEAKRMAALPEDIQRYITERQGELDDKHRVS